MTQLPEVAVGTLWEHKNGNIYEILLITNTNSTKLDEYPITVVYRNTVNLTLWSRPLHRWYASMTPITKEK